MAYSKTVRIEKAKELLQNEKYLVSKDEDNIKEWLEKETELLIFDCTVSAMEYVHEQDIYNVVENADDIATAISNLAADDRFLEIPSMSIGEFDALKNALSDFPQILNQLENI